MSGNVLVLGGYGNFGKRIATALTRHAVSVVVAGRDIQKAEILANSLPAGFASAVAFDIKADLASYLKTLKPSVVVNTCGPFQTSNYQVAETCIEQGVHYVDISDGRDFVCGITSLDARARANGVSVISGASTVPGLSSAVVQHFKSTFSTIDTMSYGIAPGQKAERGLATTQAILSYAGKPLRPAAGSTLQRYGWQDLYRENYPSLGKRWMANCDIPDLDLLPRHFGIGSIRFSAGLELSLMHLGLWLMSWIVRIGLPLNLPRHAQTLLSISNWFDVFGTGDGGMHVILTGKDASGQARRQKWYIVAKNGHGPQIPCVPAIILAKRLASAERMQPGAYPCVGLVSLSEYLSELVEYDVQVIET